MGMVRIVGRMVARDLRRHPAQAVLLLLAITAATSILTLGLALHGVASNPYQQTRAATNGPDVVADIAGPAAAPHGPGGAQKNNPPPLNQARALARLPGVTAYSGPYLQTSALLRARGLASITEIQGRDTAAAAVDQPKVTAGHWVSPGGAVLERTFAEALGVGVGDRVTLNGRPYLVVGLAVTAASTPYPNICEVGCTFNGPPGAPQQVGKPGMAWVTASDARALDAQDQIPGPYVVNLKLEDPAAAQAFAFRYSGGNNPHPTAPAMVGWQVIANADALLITDQQTVLSVGAWLTGVLAVASVAVLAGGRMAEHTRRVGLLKAVGATPGLVAVVLLAENLPVALAAAAVGLLGGWLAAPLITNPGAGLVGSPGAPSLTLPTAGLVIGVALAVALAATLAAALRASRTSTVSALADAARGPRRRATLVKLSRRLPVPLLLGLRIVARRPRRALLGAASIAVTVTGLVAVVAFHTMTGEQRFSSGGLNDPVINRDEQMLLVITVALVALAVLNAVFTAWAAALDARRSSALARALGATPQQVSGGLAAAQALPALAGALVGIPLGILLFKVANGSGQTVVPSAAWLATLVVATLVGVVLLTSIPARIAGRRPSAEVLQSETG
jgi:ABC-type lipoprotein release transport system permease subunit